MPSRDSSVRPANAAINAPVNPAATAAAQTVLAMESQLRKKLPPSRLLKNDSVVDRIEKAAAVLYGLSQL